MLKYEQLSNPTENQIKSVCFTYRHDFGFIDNDLQISIFEKAKVMWQLIENHFIDKPIVNFEFNPTEVQLKEIHNSFLECDSLLVDSASEEHCMFDTKQFWQAIYKEITEPSYISKGA